MSAALYVILVVAVSMSAAGLTIWESRSRLETYEGRHRR